MMRAPVSAVARLVLALALVWIGGCGPSEPVLPGVTPVTGVESVTVAPARSSGIPSSTPVASTPYQRPAGVYIDVRWFGGRSYDACREQVAEQFGLVEERRDLGSRLGEEYRFASGSLRTLQGIVYMIRVQLPRPVTRSEALEMTGFPPFVGNWRATHLEYRLGHNWGFERFRLVRAPGYKDRVNQLDAWWREAKRVGR